MRYDLRTKEATRWAVTLAKLEHVRAWLTEAGDDSVGREDGGAGRAGTAIAFRRYMTVLIGGCDAAQHSVHTSPRRVTGNARLRLTLEQAQRLCGVERALCKAVLDALVADKFLCVKSAERMRG